MCLSHTVEHSNHRPMRIRDDRPSHVRFGSNSTELAEATRPVMSAVPPIAAVNDRVPARVTHLASEAATLGSPLPCARLDVGTISVCMAARPPNLGREKNLLRFWCIGLFVSISRFRVRTPSEFVAHDSKLQFGSLNHGPPADLNTASVCRVRRRRRLAIGGTRKTSARREVFSFFP